MIWPAVKEAVHLDDVATRVLGVCADKHSEERGGAVVGWHSAQNLLEVVLVPGASQGPASCLKEKKRLSSKWMKEELRITV